MNHFSQVTSLNLKAAIFLIFLVNIGLLLWKKFQGVAHSTVAERWDFSEWMINYEGGFVRRGLGGQILLKAAQILGIDFTIGVQTLTIILYLFILTYFSLRLWNLCNKVWILLFLLLNPSLILFPVLDGSIFRKDLLPIFITIIHLLLVENLTSRSADANSKRNDAARRTWYYGIQAFFFVGIPAIVLSLLHETLSLLIFMPLNLFLSIAYLKTIEKATNRQSCLEVVGIYSGGMGCIIASMISKGDVNTANSICMSWQGIIQGISCSDLDNLPPAVGALKWSLRHALSYTFDLVNSGGFFIYLIIFLVIILVSVSSMANLYHQGERGRRELAILNEGINGNEISFGMFGKQKRKEFITCLYLYSLILSLPIYILGWDWGRYFFVSSMQICILVLSPLTLNVMFHFYNNYLLSSSHMNKAFTLVNFIGISPNSFYQTHIRVLSDIHRCSLLVEKNKVITLFLLIAGGLPHCCISLTRVLASGLIIKYFERF